MSGYMDKSQAKVTSQPEQVTVFVQLGRLNLTKGGTVLYKLC